MKKILMFILSAVFAFAGYGFSKTVTPSDLGCEEAVAGQELKLGKWYTNFSVCKEYADANDIPLVAVWSNHGCIHCYYLDACFLRPEFKEWQASSDAAQVIWCFMAGNESGYPDQAGSAAYNWIFYTGGAKIAMYPGVVLWHKSAGINVRTTGDAIRGNLSLTDTYIPQSTQNVIANIESAFAYWNPVKGPKLDDVSFSSKTATVKENAGTYAVEIVRTVGTNKAVTATLKAGDYNQTKIRILNTEVSWSEWEVGSKYFQIELADDEEPDGDFSVEFSIETDADSSKINEFTLNVSDNDRKEPTFEKETVECEAVQYVNASAYVKFKSYGTNTKLYKKSGALPTGMSVKLDADDGIFVLSGIPTKTGSFEATYQAAETIDGQFVYGNKVTLKIYVESIVAANASLTKTLTFKNGMVMNGSRMTGLMDLSIPKTGRVAAKYNGEELKSVVSMSASGWTDFLNGSLLAETAVKSGFYTDVTLSQDGLVEAYVVSDNSENDVIFDYIKSWTKAEFAEYAGTYNASLRQKNSNNPSSNDGYISLKISASSYGTARVSVAGMLPDGKTFSTSSTLQYNDYREIAVIPVFYKSSYDVFSAVISINADKTVGIDKSTVAWWHRIDSNTSAADTEETIKIDGLMFDRYASVADTAMQTAGSTNFVLTVDSSAIAEHAKLGKAKEIVLPNIYLTKAGVAIDKTMPNPCKLSLTYAKATGLVGGSIVIPFENGTIRGTIKGPLLNVSTLPVVYSGNINGRTIKCGFNIVLSAPAAEEEDCGCD